MRKNFSWMDVKFFQILFLHILKCSYFSSLVCWYDKLHDLIFACWTQLKHIPFYTLSYLIFANILLKILCQSLWGIWSAVFFSCNAFFWVLVCFSPPVWLKLVSVLTFNKQNPQIKLLYLDTWFCLASCLQL